MSGDWQNRLMSERMELDMEFGEKVTASDFSRQQWNMVMTAVEFDIEHPDDPDRARLVAVTDRIPSIMGEVDRINQMGQMGGGGGSSGSELAPGRGQNGSGGFLGSIKKALGVGDDGDDEQLAAAEKLAQDYADALQTKLERKGKWEPLLDEADAD